MEKEIALATRWKRFCGAFIDGFVASVILVPLAIWGRQMTYGQQYMVFGADFIILSLLNGYLLYSRGQTIGKFVIKTKIVDIQGNKPSIGKLLGLRYYLFAIPYLIPILGEFIGLTDALFIFMKDRRCLHDHLAGTQVVDARRKTVINERPASCFQSFRPLV